MKTWHIFLVVCLIVLPLAAVVIYQDIHAEISHKQYAHIEEWCTETPLLREYCQEYLVDDKITDLEYMKLLKTYRLLKSRSIKDRLN